MPASDDEFSLIQWIRNRAPADGRLVLGIGDDAAVVRSSSGSDSIITVDMLVEGVHFVMPPATPRAVGRKALAVNLSDLAAMAARPTAFVVSVALPTNRGTEFAHELHAGMMDLAVEFDVVLAGGDTNTSGGPLIVSITLFGEPTGDRPVTRSGARAGDWILVTGRLGGSLAGKHLTFQPRVDEALKLHRNADLHAMIDISDGLAADLHHILEESHVGAVLRSEAIPLSDAACELRDEKSPLEHALGDGEDFELLFTVTPDDGRTLLANPPIDVLLSHIGEIVEAGRCEIEDSTGRRSPLPAVGWKHPL